MGSRGRPAHTHFYHRLPLRHVVAHRNHEVQHVPIQHIHRLPLPLLIQLKHQQVAIPVAAPAIQFAIIILGHHHRAIGHRQHWRAQPAGNVYPVVQQVALAAIIAIGIAAVQANGVVGTQRRAKPKMGAEPGRVGCRPRRSPQVIAIVNGLLRPGVWAGAVDRGGAGQRRRRIRRPGG